MPDGAHWVGNNPRVTRRRGPRWSLSPDNITTVAQVVFLMTDEAKESFVSQFDRQLNQNSWMYNWGNRSLEPFNPSIHGPIEFWSSDQASQTRTRNDFPAVDSLTEPENPYGPPSLGLHPETVSEHISEQIQTATGFSSVRQALESGTNFLVWGGLVVGGLYLLYLMGPSVRSISELQSHIARTFHRTNEKPVVISHDEMKHRSKRRRA